VRILKREEELGVDVDFAVPIARGPDFAEVRV